MWTRLGCAGILAGSVFAQEPAVRTTVPLVQVPVTVTDKAGRFVYGLTPDDFVLPDDGTSRKIHVDDPDLMTAPLAVVVCVQITDLSDSALLKIKKVGSMMGQAVVGANGEAAVITYAGEMKVAQGLTSDNDAIAKSFQALTSVPVRQGRMLDGVVKALDMLRTRPEGARSAIVILGESKDRGSKAKLSDVLLDLQRTGTTVYTVAYSAYITPFTTKGTEYSLPEGGRGPILDALTELAQATKKDTGKILARSSSGQVLKFETKSKLENDLIRLGAEIHSRYMLSFTPQMGGSKGLHHIYVQVRNRPDLVVTCRPDYWVGS